MDRRSIIGFLLLATIVTIWFTCNSGKDKDTDLQKRHSDSIARVDSLYRIQADAKRRRADDSLKAVAAKDTTLNVDSLREAQRRQVYGNFASASKGENTPVVIENEKLKISIYPRGGRIGQVELKGVKTYSGKPLILFSPDSTHFGLEFFDAQRRRVNTDTLYFVPAGKGFSVTGKDSNSVSMRLYSDADTARGTYIEYNYSLKGNSYMSGCTVTITNGEKLLSDDRSPVDLRWSMKTPQQEKSLENERNVTTVFYMFDGEEDPEYLNEREAEHKKLTGELKWLSFKQQFFSSVIIADTRFANTSTADVMVPSDPFSVKTMAATLPMPFQRISKESFPMHFYFGPNEFSELKSHGVLLERQISLGSWIIGSMNRGIFIPLFSWLGDMLPNNYGLVILLLTIIVKIVLFPIAYKSFLSSAKMRVLKPEMDEITAQYKDGDPMKKQQATMELYRKAGVNPAAGCIPLLLQIPILFSLIRLFPAAYELRGQNFLWAEDLSTYDSVLDLGFHIPGYGDHVSLFALLMTVSTLLYTWMNQQMLSPGSTQMPGMKWLIYLMPIFFLGFLNSYSAALSYYYFLSNMITFAQMFFMRRFVDEGAIRAKIEENKKKPGKKGGFMARLEKAQRDRVKMIQEQQKGGGKKKK